MILVKKKQEGRRAYQQFTLGLLESLLGLSNFTDLYCNAEAKWFELLQIDGFRNGHWCGGLSHRAATCPEVSEVLVDVQRRYTPDYRQIVKAIWTVKIKFCLGGKDLCGIQY